MSERRCDVPNYGGIWIDPDALAQEPNPREMIRCLVKLLAEWNNAHQPRPADE